MKIEIENSEDHLFRDLKKASFLKTAIRMAVFLCHFALIIKILSILSICDDFKKIYNQFY